ncbi:acid phosphatase [Ensifer sp. NM-2]|uniref:phosphatase PAP2 family protein n=1 Tax=Ensifer TaxID=106591 RepID=UPI000D11EAB3|nr:MULTISPECIES: phosphatase PAP2 family protein [Ensifer]NOV16835.1 phosphatase PAP2 family protein [Ensifer canadensis]PSS66166.1 acid phosphatase [Ensifer sp. NM-2]
MRAYGPLGIAAFALASGGAFVFLRLTSEVVEGETRAFDEAILRALRQPGNLSAPIGPGWLTHVVTDITSLGGTTVLTLVTIVTVGYLVLASRRATGMFVLLSVLGGWLLSTLLKIGIARPRPDIVPHLVDVHDLSFPSGHAMLSAVTYLTLGLLLSQIQSRRATRLYVITVALTLTLLVGLSRIYLGVHYPTDVFGGWCAGATWATICWMIARRYLPRPEESAG